MNLMLLLALLLAHLFIFFATGFLLQISFNHIVYAFSLSVFSIQSKISNKLLDIASD